MDETNGNATKSVTLTASKRTASFVVPIGDTYHIEYGAADGYNPGAITKISVIFNVENYTHKVELAN